MKDNFSSRLWGTLTGLVLILHIEGAIALEVSPEEYEIISKFESLQQSNPVAAEEYLHESLRSTRTPPLLYQAALLEIDKKQLDKAADYFGEILEIDNQFPGVYKNRGHVYAMNNQPELAVSDLLSGTEIEGVDNNTISLLHSSYVQLGQPIAAELVLRWAILAKPQDAGLHVQLANNLLQQGRYIEAEKVAEAAIRLGANTINPWIIAANAAIGLENMDKAIDILEATRLLHKEVPAHTKWSLGELYLRQGLTRQATDLFLEVHRQQPLKDKELISLLESLLALGDGANVERFAKLLKDTAGESAETMYYRARTAELNKQVKEAIGYAKKAIQLDSGFGKAFLLLGSLYFKQGEPDNALDTIRIARSFVDLQKDALELELELWLNREEWSEVLKTLEILEHVDPGNNTWNSLMDSVLDFIARENE